MIFSQRIYWIILGYILLILLTAGTGLWLIFSLRGVIIGTLLIISSFFQIASLVVRLNSFNRKIRLFFDAVEDHDNMFYYPENKVNKQQQLLHRSLNRINALLAQTQINYQKQEHFFQSLLEQVPSGIVAWDESGKIKIANSMALHLLSCDSITHFHQLEQLLQKEENKKRFSISRNKMKLQDEQITLLSIQDIGEELNDKESESWNKFSHVLTHEIMNTIAPIISLSHTLASYPELSDKAIRGLHIIREQSERLMEFTESFRHLSYLPQPEKQSFSLSNLLRKLEELLSSDFQENQIAFALHCSPESVFVIGDEKQLSQVFLNLLKNAMQALEGNSQGTISINVEQREHVIIDITDDGCGILTEIQEKVFIPFYTTKSEGTGIGLSLCKEIVRRHNGHLFIHESKPGKTVFRMELPLSDSSI